MTREKAINIALSCVMGSELKTYKKIEVATILAEIDVDEEEEEQI